MDFRRSLLLSAFFHICLLLAGLIALPSLTPNQTSAIASIPVDLISDEDMMAGEKNAEKSETAQKRMTPTPVVRPPEEVKPEENKPPVDPKSAPSKPEETVTAPPEEKPKETPPEKAQAKPEEVDPDGLLKKIEEAKREEEKKQQEEQKKKEAEAKKKADEKKKLAEEKKKADQERLAKQAEKFDASKISNLINNQDGAQKPAADSGTEAKPSLGAKQGTGKRLTQSQTAQLIGMIQEQITPCWSPPLSASPSTSLLVVIDMSFNRDGSLNGRPQVANSNADPSFRAMADSAVRAIVRCAPLKLPADMYEGEGGWKEIKFNFDPSNIL